MNNSLRKFIFAVFLCIGFVPCKALNKAAVAYSTIGSLIIHGGIWYFDKEHRTSKDQFSFGASIQGQKFTIQMNAWTICTSLFVGMCISHGVYRGEWNAECAVGICLVAPLVINGCSLLSQYKVVKKATNKNSENCKDLE
jgi:hypothetical protein